MSQVNRGGASILVVDNDEAVTRAMSIRLRDAGYECHTAHGGGQALSVFQRDPIDLIITDLNMPCGGGAALVDSVRKTSDIPIIVVTGFSDELRDHVKGQGVFMLRKPFEIQAVLDLVELELLDRRLKRAA